MRLLLRGLAIGLAGVILSACGLSGPASAPSTSTHALSTAQPGPATPAQPAPAASADPFVQDMVSRGIARLDGMKTIQGQVVFEEFKDGQRESGKAQIYFRNRPFAGRVEIEQSDRWLAAGGVVLWNGGHDIKVKPFHMPISLNFSIDNGQMLSLRGYRMDQTDLFSMAKVLRAPNAQIRGLGPKRIRHEDLFLVQVRSSASAPGVDHEIIGLHQKHLIPAYREMYDADGQLVHRGQGLNLVFDRTVDDKKFDL
jgi:hypothetical protein